MKNLKQLFLKGFILPVVFLFISCNNDDDNNTSSGIYGAWERVGYIQDNQYHDYLNQCESKILLFNINNTGTIQNHNCESGELNVEFSWENEGDMYTLTGQSGIITPLQITFDNNDKIQVGSPEEPEFRDVYIKHEL